MAIRQINPYLHLFGGAAKAIALYERALGAKVETLMRFGDAPGMAGDGDRDQVLHAVLRIGPNVLMVSDGRPPGVEPRSGNVVDVCLDFESTEELDRAFAALAEGGKVAMPPHDTFYGGKLGVVIDPFGVSWTLNAQDRK